MNLLRAKEAVERALDLGLPLMLWGPPGVGKSSLVARVAKERALTLIDVRLAQLDATDLRGIPVPDHATRTVRWYAPSFLPTQGTGVLFLDELDKAPSLVKNAALQLVLDRRLGDYELPEGWTILCAGNREEDEAFSTPLGAALANRLLHVEVEADLDAWAAWAGENGVRGDVVDFLRFRPELLYKQTGEHAFPSPRSWAAASRLWERAQDPAAVSPAVGAGPASELSGWLKVYRAVRVADILKGKIPVLEDKDASARYAIVLAVAAHLKREGLVNGDAEGVGKLLDNLTPELRVVFFKALPGELVSRLAAHPALRKAASRVVLDYVGG